MSEQKQKLNKAKKKKLCQVIVINKSPKNKKALKIAVVMAAGSFLAGKVIGYGGPFYQDNIKKNLVITSEIDMEGNEEEISREYSFFEGITKSYNIQEMQVLNYSEINTKTGYRYIEKYDAINMTEKEILEILADENVSLESVLGEPEITKEQVSYENAVNKKSGIRIQKKKVIEDDYIVEKEDDFNNLVSSILAVGWIPFFLLGYLMFGDYTIELQEDNYFLVKREKEKEELIRKLKLENDKRK